MSSISGLGLTTDDQLRLFAKDMHVKLNYIGFAENLPKRTPVGFNIINLGGPETRDQGTHWVLWYVDPYKKYAIYADSYGGPPEDAIVQKSPKELLINYKQLQGYNEEYCGIWAITLAGVLNRAEDKKKAFEEFIAKFKQVK